MARRASVLELLRRSLKRKGRVDELPATDPGEAATEAALEALDAALPGRLNVVGNAASLLEARHGGQIDAAPTLRFNAAQIAAPEAQGTRWDFVATSDRRTLAFYSETPPRFHTLIFTPYYDRHLDHLEDKRFDTPHLVYPMRLSIELMARLRARPTTGAQILWLLHRLGRREVGIFGFDWKRTPTFYDRERVKDPHNHFGEMMLFTRLIRRHGWRLYR